MPGCLRYDHSVRLRTPTPFALLAVIAAACASNQPGAADLAPAPDLAMPADFSSPPDLRSPPDLGLPPDLSVPPDLSPPSDLRPPPDLSPPPDLGPLLGSLANPAPRCQAILAAGASVGDGVYYLSAAGVSFQAYCDMTRDGGGWALLLRARKTTPLGWGTTGALNLVDLPNRAATTSSKASDAAINAVLSTGYRVESTNCTGATAATVYFKPDCKYQHNTDTSGSCQTFYPTAAFATASTGIQYGSYQGLSSYTDATRTTTSIIVHDPVSGAGNDSWWSGGANFCDLNVWVK